MADDPKIKLIKVQQSLLRDLDIGNVLSIPRRPEGPSMRSGIGVLLEGTEFTLLDAVEFEKKTAELIRNQEFPPQYGYFWVEKNRLEQITTGENATFTIKAGDIRTGGRTTGGGVGKVPGTQVQADTLREKLYELNPLLRKIAELKLAYKKSENVPIYYNLTNSFSLNEQDFRNILLKENASIPLTKLKTFYIYSSTEKEIVLFSANFKKLNAQDDASAYLLEGDIKKEGPEKLDLKLLGVEPLAPTDAGHLQGIQTKGAEAFEAALDELIQTAKSLKDGVIPDSYEFSKTDFTIFWPGTKTAEISSAARRTITGYKVLPGTIAYLEDLKRKARKLVEDLSILDRIFISAAASLNPTIDSVVEAAKVTLAAAGAGDAIFIKTITDGTITSEKINIAIAYSLDALTPEYRWNREKGGLSGGVVATYISTMKKIAAMFEQAVKAEAAKEAGQRYSSSMIEILLLLNLDKIFNVKNFSKLIDKRKNQKTIALAKISARSKSKKLKFPKALFKAVKLGSSRRANRKPKSGVVATQSLQPTSNIVALINADLKRYLLAEMTQGNALRNRSGVFASSVKVLSAEEEAAVQYTYEANPYSIFEKAPVGRRDPRTGEKARPAPFYLDRRPSEIIDKAIKKLGQDKFQKVFRTQKV